MISFEFNNVIFRVYLSGKEAVLNLDLYLSDVSPK